MKTLSIGKFRGLQSCSDRRGTFTCLALDHRQNLRRALRASGADEVPDAELTRFKLEVSAALADLATAVLLDPEYGAAQAIAAGAVPGQTGLVVALEATGYAGDPAARRSRMLPGWSAAKARRMGTSMAKLLVYYHPEAPTAPQVEAFVRQVAGECAAQDLALMLEPLSYSLVVDRKLSSAEKRSVVTGTARRLTVPGVDMLKVEFPFEIAEEVDDSKWAAACTEISKASPVPWIVLSAAAKYETYLRQAEAACRAGASGVAVGRAVWQEAVSLGGEARRAFLQDVARPRLKRLASLCAGLARPWTEFYSPEEITADWFKAYGMST